MSNNCKHPTCYDSEVCRREPKQKKAPAPLKRQRVPLKRTAIKRYNAKPKPKNDELEQFFDDCASIIAKNPYCAECFEWIPPNLYRFATAHILPKKIFDSVKTHPLNWLVLGSTCGCHEKTHRLDTFSKMRIFKNAVNRFRNFEPEIKESNNLLDTFRTYANEICPLK